VLEGGTSEYGAGVPAFDRRATLFVSLSPDLVLGIVVGCIVMWAVSLCGLCRYVGCIVMWAVLLVPEQYLNVPKTMLEIAGQRILQRATTVFNSTALLICSTVLVCSTSRLCSTVQQHISFHMFNNISLFNCSTSDVC
jgi:hypothetical protein